MSIAKIAGIVTGIVVAVLLVVLMAVLFRKQGGAGFGRAKYDERQLLARGKAYRAGFFTVLIYELLYAFGDLMELRWTVPFTGVMIGLFLGIAVFGVVAICQDAYLSLNEKPRGWYPLWGIIILANGACVASQAVHQELIQDGMLTTNWLNALCCGLFVVILVAQLLHSVRSRREEMEDEA